MTTRPQTPTHPTARVYALLVLVLVLALAAVLVAACAPAARAHGAEPAAISAATAGVVPSGGSTPWVVLKCQFSDIATEPKSAAFFEDLFTETGAGKRATFDYWQDISGGNVDLTGSEVHGWFPMSTSLETATNWKWPGARTDLMRECIAAADDEVDFRPFYGIIAVINGVVDSGSAGRQTLTLDGASKTYGLINLDPLAWFNTFAAHEMGHGYGLPHSFSEQPTFREYGDGWDIMSAETFGGTSPWYWDADWGKSGPGLSAAYRDLLGWIPSSERIDLSSFSGGSTITLSGLDGGPPGTKLARVWLGFSTQYYTVELRTPTGWDRGLSRSGVLVRRVHNGVSYLRQSKSGTQDMQPGDSYVDAFEDVAVSVLGIDDALGTATVHIGPVPPATLRTSATLSPAANAAGWHSEVQGVPLQVRVGLSAATAAGGQVDTVTYSATGANPLPTTAVRGRSASFGVQAEGRTMVTYAAKEASGAGELPRQLEVKIDKTPPESVFKVDSLAAGVHEVELTATDAGGSGFKHLQYYVVGSNPIPLTTITQARTRFLVGGSGHTTVFYWSTDNADGVEGPHSLTFKPKPVVTPKRLHFVAPPGGSSAPQTVFLENAGDATLGIQSIDTTDNAFAVRTSAKDACGATLAPGATCRVDVVFGAVSATAFKAALLISTNAASQPITVPLTGEGATAELEFDPASLTFPTTVVRKTSPVQTATVRNPGRVPLVISEVTPGVGTDYVLTRDGCGSFPRTLQPGDACGVDVAFSPRGDGPRPGGLMVRANVAGGLRVLPFDGEGVALPELTAAPAALAFGDQPQGTTGAPSPVEVTNTGTADLRITGASLQGAHDGDYDIVGGSCVPTAKTPVVVVEPERSCRLEAGFRPTAVGARQASLVLTTNVPGPAQPIPLSGTGTTAPTVTLDPTTVAFGSQAVGTTGGQRTVTLTNNGSGPVEVRGAEPTAAHRDDFAVATDACAGTTVPAGGTCTVGVRFTPTAIGARAAALTVTAATGDAYEAVLAGTGTGAQVAFEPASHDFGPLQVGGSERYDVTVRNTGNAILSIGSVAATGDFLAGQTCNGVGVAPGSYCTVRVVFRPTAAGPRTGELVVSSDALGAPDRMAVSGTGTLPGITLGTSSLAFGEQAVGQSSPAQAVTVSSTGTAPLSVGEVALTGAHPGDFKLQDSCGWRGHMVGASCTIGVVFAPTAPGARTAAVTIKDNALGNPHSFTVTGTGT